MHGDPLLFLKLKEVPWQNAQQKRSRLSCAGHADQLSEADAMNEDDNSKHVSSTFRGVYKRKFDTKWRAEITAGTASAAPPLTHGIGSC